MPLKSNMDRFIVKLADTTSSLLPSLKSNMDRFIVAKNRLDVTNKITLKSNMDRFIVNRSFVINRFIGL